MGGKIRKPVDTKTPETETCGESKLNRIKNVQHRDT